jgi:glucosamine kinase
VNYFLGVDAGGSHCRARVTVKYGHVLGAASRGAANARIGLEKLTPTLLAVVEEAFSTAGLSTAAMAET